VLVLVSTEKVLVFDKYFFFVCAHVL
jgi:hypothetical protein